MSPHLCRGELGGDSRANTAPADIDGDEPLPPLAASASDGRAFGRDGVALDDAALVLVVLFPTAFSGVNFVFSASGRRKALDLLSLRALFVAAATRAANFDTDGSLWS